MSLHLNVFVVGHGHHEAAWRHPRSTTAAVTDVAYFQSLARRAEEGLLDSVFFADQLVLGNGDAEFRPRGGLEPLTLLAALATVTERIGLIATASTTYTEPFNLARQLASLDHISHGRIGWNIVTSWAVGAAANFGLDRPIPHDERYARAFEYMEVVTRLWDSWADDAVVHDQAAGRFADPAKIREAGFEGRFYRVKGAGTVPRPPQGHPVLVQAGSSEEGRRFAAHHAEAIFTAQQDMAEAVEFAADVRRRASAAGRDPRHLRILPGLSPIIGSTEEEARRLERELNELTLPEVGLRHLSARFDGADLSGIPLDEPLSVDALPKPSDVQGPQSRAKLITDLVRRERPTLRELLYRLAGARGHLVVTGTPEQIADTIEQWAEAGAADGFNIMPPHLPGGLDDFIDHVVPELQRRGLFRKEYEGTTLRDHYNLPRPRNRVFGP
ncbi:monooxygenase [Actinomadura sp. NBRC 104412]|uniref:LLM class flavin-dependent oxidoreductase n=1 Tax=Actinomadura sp. NBRC 104412 TaxID=3032203 RepID=UPI00249F9875|nr:LLM class flavin-dependent oxidoreductase [Actinomadura sp. NBRC 104412]GLZ02701.1 monooxygenase [Actinomadura sp. NBRC 104412]